MATLYCCTISPSPYPSAVDPSGSYTVVVHLSSPFCCTKRETVFTWSGNKREQGGTAHAHSRCASSSSRRRRRRRRRSQLCRNQWRRHRRRQSSRYIQSVWRSPTAHTCRRRRRRRYRRPCFRVRNNKYLLLFIYFIFFFRFFVTYYYFSLENNKLLIFLNILFLFVWKIRVFRVWYVRSDRWS